jgi:vacuolar-type H+-ATPase subunit H
VHADLERIVSADEEARSRVALAEQRRERELTTGRTGRDASIEARRREAHEALDRELQAIRSEGDARVDELRRQQEQYLTTLTASGERRFDEAVALYRRVVCEVTSCEVSS